MPTPKVSTEVQMLNKNLEVKNFDILGLEKSNFPTVALYSVKSDRCDVWEIDKYENRMRWCEMCTPLKGYFG